MSNSYFKFKQFTVFHDKCAMKVGADGVTLGAWADGKKAKSILDAGAGSGLIALMLAQRFNAEILAIDVDNNCIEQAQLNVNSSPWKNRISVGNISLQHLAMEKIQKFDTIVCNPPYFVSSLKSPSPSRTLARHNDSLSFSELIISAKSLLKEDGNLCLILPVEEGNKFIEMAKNENLFCVKKVFVFPNQSKLAKRLLLEFKPENAECEISELIIEQQRGVYTPEYAELVKDFYLKL